MTHAELPAGATAEVAPAGPVSGGAAAAGPWRAVARAIRRSWPAKFAVAVVVLIVVSSAAAPLWAKHVAHTGPFTNNLAATVTIDGKETDVVSIEGIPIGPTFQQRFALGADKNGRDVMVRLLYAGRNSLIIGVLATLFSILVGALLALLGGWYRGWTDGVISRGLDVLWAFPVLLLGVGLGVASAAGDGLHLGPITISDGSLLLPAFIIGLINVVYVARPLRSAVLSLRERPFVEAARAQGLGSVQIMRRELLPNLVTGMLVLTPIVFAQTVGLEAALSFLGAGVQPPNPSWGTMISSGMDLLVVAPYLTIVPGVVLCAMVLAMNVLGDVVQDALDPRGQLAIKAEQGER